MSQPNLVKMAGKHCVCILNGEDLMVRTDWLECLVPKVSYHHFIILHTVARCLVTFSSFPEWITISTLAMASTMILQVRNHLF